jgi:hypothetical protein
MKLKGKGANVNLGQNLRETRSLVEQNLKGNGLGYDGPTF